MSFLRECEFQCRKEIGQYTHLDLSGESFSSNYPYLRGILLEGIIYFYWEGDESGCSWLEQGIVDQIDLIK